MRFRLLCAAVLGNALLAGSGRAQDAPDATAVTPALCVAEGLGGRDCDDAVFSRVGSLDVDGDGRLEWVFVLTRGGDELCHVRHACFAIVGQGGAGWAVLLRGMGETVGLAGRPRRGHRDLIVSGANSADEQHVTLHRWRGRRGYVAVRSRDCLVDAGTSRDPLCAAIAEEVVLQ